MSEAPSDIKPPTTWQELDAMLGDLRQTVAEIERTSAEHDVRIQAEETAKAEACAAGMTRRKEIEKVVLGFVRDNRGDFLKKKSMKLVHGVVGFRAGTAKLVFAKSEVHTLRALLARDLDHCVKTRQLLVKAKLKELPPAEQLAVGVSIRSIESAYYKLKEAPVVNYPEASS